MATLCLSGDAIIKAGTNVGAVPAAAWDGFIEEAEGYLRAVVKFDVVGNWAAISGEALILSEYCARDAAVQGILYDPSGYTSLIEAEDMVTMHIYRLQEIQRIIEKADVQDYMGTT